MQGRLEQLADKSTAGELSDDERAEYETYVRAVDFIAILQLKARRILGAQSETNVALPGDPFRRAFTR